MEIKPKEVVFYLDVSGKAHVREWLGKLKDLEGKASIAARLRRLERGLLGDCQRYGSITELRIHFGPGYRVYLGEDGPVLVILLCAGDKSSQKKDFNLARRLWDEYQKEKGAGAGKLRRSSE